LRLLRAAGWAIFFTAAPAVWLLLRNAGR
jgi:hypothetical protein